MSTTEYAVIIRRSVYAGTTGIDGHAHWVTEYDRDGRGTDEPATWPTVDAARAWIAEQERGVYHTAHGEAGRPEYWVVPVDAVYDVMAAHEDIGRYPWPGPDGICDGPSCDGDGDDYCGECAECTAWMASQDDARLEDAKVTEQE